MLTRLVHAAARLRAFFHPAALDRELHDEWQAHLALLVEDYERRGLAPDEARRRAHVAMGGLPQLRDAHRDQRGLPLLDTFLQDLRYTVRTLRRDLGFTTFAILIVGLGIGAASTVFSVVNALLLQPLPFHEPERLVWMANRADDGVGEWNVQVGHFVDLRAQSQAFADLAAFAAIGQADDAKLTGAGEPERFGSVGVSENFFAFLGVTPALGRSFTPEECVWNGPPVVILSDAIWRRRFGADPNIIGRTLTINEYPIVVVGVLPAWFDFASVFSPGVRRDFFRPFPLTAETNRWGNTLGVIARLQPGATIETARAEMTVLARQLEQQHPQRNTLRPILKPLEERVAGRLRPALLVLASAVAVVMLIVCVNLSNLLLARTTMRQKEMAVRVALGASRGRLIRQMLTESVVLSSCGALLGLVLAVAGTRMLSRMEMTSIPLLDRVQVDGWTLGATMLAAILTGLIFGMMPALQVRATSVHEALKESARGSTSGEGRAWMRAALAVSEVALACVLLVAAGLLVRSFIRVLDLDLGFRPEQAASLRLDPGREQNTLALRVAWYDEVLGRVREIPGIRGAGLTDVLPLGGNRSWAVAGKGQVYEKGRYPEGFARVVSEGYLDALGLRLVAGRDFTAHDAATSEKVIIINETMARTLWPGEEPIGQVMTQDGGRRVIGVVADVRHHALEDASGAEMYLPIRQTTNYSNVHLVVRTDLPTSALAPAVRAALASVVPNLSANAWRPLQQLVDKAISPRRFVVLLLGGFSAFALVLASLGIYAVISYSVGQRTQEIGIRVALGASPRALQARILLQTLRLAAIGMLIGIAAAWLLGHQLSALLFGVTATDPVTFVTILSLLTLVAAIAGYVPARRASRIDPIVALRVQ